MTRIDGLLNQGTFTQSFEFFPPKNPEQEAAFALAFDKIAHEADVTFASITYGALGSTRDTTRDTVLAANAAYDFPTMPHLTCVGHRQDEIEQFLDSYRRGGVDNVLALRGDGNPPGDFGHALDLVKLIKERHADMAVGVAAHPELHPDSMKDREADRRHLANKLLIADFAITQFMLNAVHYDRLQHELDKLGCDKPILPGVMLFTTLGGLERMTAMNETEFPDDLHTQLQAASADDIAKIALDEAIRTVEKLRSYGAPGVHIYTLNRSHPAIELSQTLSAQIS